MWLLGTSFEVTSYSFGEGITLDKGAVWLFGANSFIDKDHSSMILEQGIFESMHSPNEGAKKNHFP